MEKSENNCYLISNYNIIALELQKKNTITLNFVLIRLIIEGQDDSFIRNYKNNHYH
jgi:hypothetical protein